MLRPYMFVLAIDWRPLGTQWALGFFFGVDQVAVGGFVGVDYFLG
jgi:hypothetical protein